MKILVTGAAGYIGSQLLEELQNKTAATLDDMFVYGIDIREEAPYVTNEQFNYYQMDVRDPNLASFMKEKEIEVVIHLASIVTPGKKSNRDFEYSVDVLGTKNVLEACVAAAVHRVVVTSSGAAYGYHSDNPEWLVESDALRGNEEFAYSHHKRLVEEMLADYRTSHPELQQVIFRIGTILGPRVKNQITNLFEKPVVLGIRGTDSPFVFVWDHDLIQCLVRAISEGPPGIYNVAGDGAMTISEIAHVLKKKVVRLPAMAVRSGLFVLKRLGVTQYGEEQLNFLRYRPVLSNTHLKTVFGYEPTYSSREVFTRYVEKRWE